jgi:hypothetical protein
MKNLSTCQVCKGQIWKSKHKYYNGVCIAKDDKEFEEEMDANARKMGIPTMAGMRIQNIRVMTLPFSWAVKGFFSKKVVDIETIKICVMCFVVCANNEKMLFRDNDGVWKPKEHKKHGPVGGTVIAYYLKSMEKQEWSDIRKVDAQMHQPQIYENIQAVLSKVVDDTDKYRTLVADLAVK